GIRDKLVTGVQTCALPIFGCLARLSVVATLRRAAPQPPRRGLRAAPGGEAPCPGGGGRPRLSLRAPGRGDRCGPGRGRRAARIRSEERRVGKGGRRRGAGA